MTLDELLSIWRADIPSILDGTWIAPLPHACLIVEPFNTMRSKCGKMAHSKAKK